MAYQNDKNSITIPREKVSASGGMVILPLEEYERLKEDLEMSRSQKLIKEIKKSRNEVKRGKLINLEEVERRSNL